jgi:multimeric flavodoxin WrbA
MRQKPPNIRSIRAPVAQIEELANHDAISLVRARDLVACHRKRRAFWIKLAAFGARERCKARWDGAFSSSATQHGGEEMTLLNIIKNVLHFGMTIVGLNYGFSDDRRRSDGWLAVWSNYHRGVERAATAEFERNRRSTLPRQNHRRSSQQAAWIAASAKPPG